MLRRADLVGLAVLAARISKERVRSHCTVRRVAVLAAALGAACTGSAIELSKDLVVAQHPARDMPRIVSRAAGTPSRLAELEAAADRSPADQLVPVNKTRPPECSLAVGADRQAAAIEPDATPTATIQEAVDQAQPGDVICVFSAEHLNERVLVSRSGSREAPIQIRAIGKVWTAGFVVQANHISIEGFSVTNRGRGQDDGRGMGIYLAGTGFQIRNNEVINTDAAGIGCEHDLPRCTDVVIADNVVRGASGSGIIVLGQRILVRDNDIAHSIMPNGGNDADGIRFFGSDIVIRGNYVHDIYDRGYPSGKGPHTDCFQTFDNDKPPTVSVTIENNICYDVDHQCLIATGITQKQSSLLTFRNNLCANNGSQPLLIGAFPSVVISNNLFVPSAAYHGVMLEAGSQNAVIANNVFYGTFRAYVADASSLPGLIANYNLVFNPDEPEPPDWWQEEDGMWGIDPQFAGFDDQGPPAMRTCDRPACFAVLYRPADGSPLIDNGNNDYGGSETDLAGVFRVQDGRNDGASVVDIGPYEKQFENDKTQ